MQTSVYMGVVVLDSTRVLNCNTLQCVFCMNCEDMESSILVASLCAHSLIFSYVSISVYHMTVIVKGNYHMCYVRRK